MNLKAICPYCDERKDALIQLPITVFREDGKTLTRDGYGRLEVICFDCLKVEVDELGEGEEEDDE